MLGDREFDLFQTLFDSEWVVTGETNKPIGILLGVLEHIFELRIHVHPFAPVRPHLGLRDEDFLDAGVVHLSQHLFDRSESRQPADGFLHATDQFALFVAVPLFHKFGRGDVVHEIDCFDFLHIWTATETRRHRAYERTCD